jgi:radical SAM superfamily enzyme YgiQ (UPF0313 family)
MSGLRLMSDWSPEDISKFINTHAYKLDGPAQWLGNEPNSRHKDWDSASFRMLMAASWPYDQAAGNQSIPAVWKAINDKRPDYLCDRYYLPATPRDMRIFERGGVPVFGIESRHGLGDFDVVGTSISYVVLLINFCKYLTMSGVPLRWRDRVPEDHPMIMIGGQAFCNPEAMAPIADCIFVGEAEDEPGNGGIGQVCRMIEMFKKEGSWNVDRVGCYERLARSFNYLYFPRFVEVHYGDREGQKQVTGYSSSCDGMRMPFRKRHVINLDNIKPLDDPPLLYVDPSLGSGDVEQSRGCPAWCTFCRLSWAQKPFRQRSVEYMTGFAKQFQSNIGGVELSPFGPDFPMATNKNALLKSLLENVSDKIDTVAQRIDDFISDDTYLILQAVGGARSITLGLEGTSQRMRDLVGKATSEAEVREAVTRGIRAGFKKFKLFMIVGLPGEDTGDIAKIMSLARSLADIRDSLATDKVQIQFSFTPLLYEAQTPFQWFPTWPVPDHDLIDVAAALKEIKVLFKIGVKGETNKVHFFQLCQRASKDAGEAIIDVLEEMDQGCWGGVPKIMQVSLDAALKKRGFANGFGDLFGERDRGDMLGWEFIDTGISRDLLWDTFVKMREFAERTDSTTYDTKFDERYHGNEWINRCDEQCLGNHCGVCSRRDLELRRDYLSAATADRKVEVSRIRPVDQTTVAVRVRARLDRPESYRYADNGFRRHLLRRAGYRAQEALGGPCVSKNAIWFASDAHGYRDWTYGTDYADFGLTRRILNDADAGDLAERTWMRKLRVELAPWLDLKEWKVYPATVSMRSASGASLHELEINDAPDRVRARLNDWEMSEYIPLKLRQEGSYFAAAMEEVNAKDFVNDLWLVRDGTRLLLKMLARHRAGPYQVYQALMGKPSWIEAAQFPARTLDVFSNRDELEGLSCPRCGGSLPESLMGVQWDGVYCARCKDERAGIVLAGLTRETYGYA